MKVILLADVKSVGKKGDVVEVSDGYGQNFLLPRKLAATATDGAVKPRKKHLLGHPLPGYHTGNQDRRIVLLDDSTF